MSETGGKTVNAADKIDKNSFDVALVPGARLALQEAYRDLRRAEEAYYATAAHQAAECRDRSTVRRACPLCAAAVASPFLRARGLEIVRCQNCGHVYSQDIFSEEFEIRRYAAGTAGVWPAYLKLKEHPVLAQVERHRNGYYLDACERYAAVGRMLDVGSGNGSLLHQAAERGWDVQGLDPNPVWQEIRQSLGVRPKLGRFPDDLAAGERFELIAMLDILEHVADPISFLRAVHRHLAPGGIVFVQVPNLNSLAMRLEGAANNNFCPGHWSYYDAESLHRLASSCGFEVLWCDTVISELDRVLSFSPEQILAMAQVLAPGSLSDVASLTPEWMHDHLLGYKLVCILRPRGGQ